MSTPSVTFTTPLSPYQFAKMVGKRPQMVYNYISNGMITTRSTETGKMVLDVDEMTKWYTKWSKKTEEVK